MFGKKFFSTLALGGAAVSLIGNVGSFAEESLPSDGGILFKCKNPGITCEIADFDAYGVNLQLLVNHFCLDREETEKLLKCMKLYMEKAEKLGYLPGKNWYLDPDYFPEAGQIAFGARGDGGNVYSFCISKLRDMSNDWLGGTYKPYLIVKKSEFIRMLACNLDNISFAAADPISERNIMLLLTLALVPTAVFFLLGTQVKVEKAKKKGDFSYVSNVDNTDDNNTDFEATVAEGFLL